MKILFMCVANSARSQLAEGLAKRIFPDAEIRSAGSHPGKLNPFAVAVMNEIGIDISKQYSKSIDELPVQFIVAIDFIITLCAEEVCPTMVAQKAKRLHWPVADPATQEPISELQALKRFRDARDAINKRLVAFKAELNN